VSLLTVNGLAKSFGAVAALNGVSFELGEGEILALIGPNGAGKTTCLNILGGQLRPERGSIRLNGRELVGLPARRLCRLGVGRTFQIAAVFGSMTVRENVQMALIAGRRRVLGLWRPAGALYVEEAIELLERVGMADQAERLCGLLAYGDLKRVELAIALANWPVVLLMDEPTAGMAPEERRALMRLSAEIARERRMGILFTEHDMDVVFAHADRIIVLDRGEIIAEGAPSRVRQDARVREVYLGQVAGAA
jgi:branched-chain amino acid transport system ATP-binding protein